ncbi:MAG: hypothetical protein GBAus27B_000585 [Mycoplasmataceae bacterium]|nr:MAG: hypothetical protein GBAus27B_000585 [Mycoplasmataceae bacterium]
MVLASEYLAENYPKEGTCVRENEAVDKKSGKVLINNFGKKRAEITVLQLDNQNLTETLDLSDFINLAELQCWENNLTQIILPPNNQLEDIAVGNNHLTSWDYTKLNPETLTKLYLWNNNLKPTDLAVFSHLINLIHLEIGNTDDQAQTNNYNKFFGSLSALANCTKLKELDIANTNINQGLEYLPESLETFSYSAYDSNFKVQELEQAINQLGGDWKTYQEKFFEEWKNQGFNNQEINERINFGFDKMDKDDKIKFIIYLKDSGYTPQDWQTKKSYAQHWLDCFYPPNGTCVRKVEKWEVNNYGEKRSEITELNIRNKSLIGSLDLAGFVNLTELDCADNRLTKLDLTENSKLKKLECNYNQFVELFFPIVGELKELDCRNNQLVELDLSNCPNLVELNCSKNRLTKLDLTNQSNLEGLDCSNNKLTKLKLPIKNKLRLIEANDNLLTTFDYECLNPKTLTGLELANNNLESELSVFSELTNLRRLHINNNHFFGSLKSLSKLNELSNFKAWGNEEIHLPSNSKYYDGKIANALKFYDDNLQLCRVVYGSKEDDISYSSEPIRKISTLDFLQKQKNLTQNLVSSQTRNDQFKLWWFSLRNERLFYWKGTKNLPTRLYNLTSSESKQSVTKHQELKEYVEETVNNPNIQRYACLSYVCGQAGPVGEIYPNARRALDKAIGALEFLNNKLNESKNQPINHIWLDQLCIRQDSTEDKDKEIPQMKEYYRNSLLTLIAIDGEIGKRPATELELIEKILTKIYNSTWFQRTWTLQEGLLSKQTIFMFDDALVDGRLLASMWGNWEKGNLKDNSINKYFETGDLSPIFITPLGWSYGAQPHHSVNLNLGEALKAVQHRQQTVAIDGIYAILGLLPYGDRVKVEYKEKLCKNCKAIEEQLRMTINCSCQGIDKTEWPQYFEEDFEQALLAVFRAAKQAEADENKDKKEDEAKVAYFKEAALSWLGERNSKYWYLPRMDDNGSAQIKESLLYDNSEKGIKKLLAKIGQINTRGFEVLEGYLVNGGDIKWVEIGTGWGIKIIKQAGEIVIERLYSNNLIIIKLMLNQETREKAASLRQEGLQRLFIDFEKKDIITKEKDFIRYHQRLNGLELDIQEQCQKLTEQIAENKEELKGLIESAKVQFKSYERRGFEEDKGIKILLDQIKYDNDSDLNLSVIPDKLGEYKNETLQNIIKLKNFTKKLEEQTISNPEQGTMETQQKQCQEQVDINLEAKIEDKNKGSTYNEAREP